MRLIPGKTKVQIEIFKGITLWDLLVAAVGLIVIALIFSSSLVFKIAFIAAVVLIEVVLLARIDNEPNYMYFLYVIKHFAYRRKFSRLDYDADLVGNGQKSKSEIAFDTLFGEEGSETEHQEETKEERKKRLKAEKAEKKADNKILRDRKIAKAEKDAIWLKRANQSAAKKKERQYKKYLKDRRSDKWGDMEDLSSFSDIADGFINFHDEYYGAAIEIPAIEFKFFGEYRRNNCIENGFGSILRAVKPEYCGNILKIERPINYATYEAQEYQKVEALKRSFENGLLDEEELKARLAIVYDRITEIQKFLGLSRVVVPFYYLILFDSNRDQLNVEIENAIDSLRIGEMEGKRLNDKELALMLKYSNSLDFNENEINDLHPEDYARWAMPQEVEFAPRVSMVDGMATHNFRVISFPSIVNDAWLASVMTYPSTKVMVKFKPMDSTKTIRAIDRSLSELRGTVYNAKTDSQAMEAQTHLESLELLLNTLQSDNEILLNTNIYVTAYDYVYTENNAKFNTPKGVSFRSRIAEMKKAVRRIWSEQGFKLNKNEFNQAMAYIGSQVSGFDPMEKQGRGLPSNTLAATFPWVFPYIMDKKGVQIGTSDTIPVFVDFFERSPDRVNSNMVIIGKSGSGKSFATKSLLCNLAAEDAKIFVLDPENEYGTLASNVHGKVINLATNLSGRINPFHIVTNLEDETNVEMSTGYASHLQFLEEFFKQILDCDRESLEHLNILVDRTYRRKGIDSNTDLSKLKPEDYPIFDDLYDEILLDFQKTRHDYLKTLLRTLMNQVSKFSDGGRNAILWNGPSSITTKENFIVFDFQSLLSNRNTTVANAQMLLVLKYIDNEISKNRDYNRKYGLNRKIVVVIDEAHVFIDTKYPIALDFMFQLAKRIRKYNGMQIVITQNVKDFVGSEEIARKSTAIINASQYSFIFAQSPNDMQDLCTLYEKAGGINEIEQEQMVQAPRGQAFAMMSPSSRCTFKIVAPDDTQDLFKNPDYVNPYFFGDKGEKAWREVLGNSAEIRAAALEKINEEAIQNEVDDALKELGILYEEPVQIEPLAEPIEIETIEQPISIIEENPKVDFVEDTLEDENVSEEIPIIIESFDTAFDNAGKDFDNNPVTAYTQPNNSRTEEILAGLVDKLSTNSIIDEIQRLVKAEMDNRFKDSSVPITAKVAESNLFDYNRNIQSEKDVSATLEDVKETIMPLADEFDITDIFGSIDEITSSDQDNESKDGSTALGSIFDYADVYADDDEEDEDEDNTTIDVVALLSHDMNKAIASDKFIENFIKSSDMTAEVTLEQLIAYTRQMHDKK